MSTSEEAFAAPIVETVNGKQVSFPRLFETEYGAIEAMVRQARRAHIRSLADACKLQGADRFVALRDYDTPWVSEPQVFSFLHTHEGARKAVLMSLDKNSSTNGDAESIVKSYSFSDLANLATALIGLSERRRPFEAESTDEGKNVDPENPTATPGTT